MNIKGAGMSQALPLTHIINLVLQIGTFPTVTKRIFDESMPQKWQSKFQVIKITGTNFSPLNPLFFFHIIISNNVFPWRSEGEFEKY